MNMITWARNILTVIVAVTGTVIIIGCWIEVALTLV